MKHQIRIKSPYCFYIINWVSWFSLYLAIASFLFACVIIAISNLANMGDTQVYNYACVAIADMCLANGLQLHDQFAPENDTLPNQAINPNLSMT